MILDIIIVVLFILMILYGYKKGCIGIIAKLISVIVAFVLAYILADNIGGYIAGTSLGINIQTSIENNILDKLSDSDDAAVILMIQEYLKVADEQVVTDKVSNYIFTGIGFVTVFVVARIVLWIAQKILESIFELPVLKTFNKLGGIITATVLFIIEISIILSVIKSISTLAFINGVVNVIQSSVITRALYNHNIFTSLILNKII